MRNKTKFLIVFILSISLSSYIGWMLSIFIKNENTELEGYTPIYIAPYISHTHACTFHTESCTGELPNALIRYNISSNNNIFQMIGDGFTKSNEFFTLYMPMNQSYVIQMRTNIINTNYEANTEFETYIGSPNCITTGQLLAL